MSHVLRVGVADQIAYFRAYNTDGSAKTDLTSSTTGLALSVFRIGASSVSIASLSNKAADNTAHADGAIRNVGGNLYTIDIPDAATATQVPSIVVRGSYTGGVVEGLEHPIVAYDPSVNYGTNAQSLDIQSRLPATLDSGNMRSSVQSMAADTLTASALAADAVTEIQSGLALQTTLIAVGNSVVAVGSVVDGKPTLTQIEASTVLAKQNTLTTGVTDILTAVGDIETGVDNETISQLVFQSIVGSGLAKYSIPQVTGTIEAVKYADLELSISASTASDSILYLSIGCENHTTPNLQADSTDGLTILNQLEDFDPTDVTVQRTSPTVVDVWISARVLSKLTAADYLIALTEITTDDKTKLRFEKCFTVRSGVGRIIG